MLSTSIIDTRISADLRDWLVCCLQRAECPFNVLHPGLFALLSYWPLALSDPIQDHARVYGTHSPTSTGLLPWSLNLKAATYSLRWPQPLPTSPHVSPQSYEAAAVSAARASCEDANPGHIEALSKEGQTPNTLLGRSLPKLRSVIAAGGFLMVFTIFWWTHRLCRKLRPSDLKELQPEGRPTLDSAFMSGSWKSFGC